MMNSELHPEAKLVRNFWWNVASERAVLLPGQNMVLIRNNSVDTPRLSSQGPALHATDTDPLRSNATAPGEAAHLGWVGSAAWDGLDGGGRADQ